MQNVDGYDVQALIEALNTKLELQQEQIHAQNERIRRLEGNRRWYRNSPVIGLFFIMVFVFLVWDNRFALAQAEPDSSSDPLGVTAVGEYIRVAYSYGSPPASTPTQIFNLSSTELSTNLLKVDNSTSIQLLQPPYTRVAIMGSVSGTDTDDFSKAGVLGMADISGYGVWGKGTSAIGVYGDSIDSVGVFGGSINSSGVYGFSTWAPGVSGSSSAREGVYANSLNNYGVVAGGGLAPLRLMPATKPGAPSAGDHEMGELYVDSEGNLYFCTKNGTPGKWIKLNGSAVYLPTITK
ncbi:MAG: hypothetical protein EHM41_13270 [Chloroflexi bacterium]|nr:MAG: hypothetical protein EHM41_13270 [Chloroflexota bacterium]